MSDRPGRPPPLDFPAFVDMLTDDRRVEEGEQFGEGDLPTPSPRSCMTPGAQARRRSPKSVTQFVQEFYAEDGAGPAEGPDTSNAPDVHQRPATELRTEPRHSAGVDLQLLQGVWIDVTYGSSDTPVGIIDGVHVCWNQALFSGHEHTELCIVPEGKLSMEVGAVAYTATCALGPPARIIWSDGATWVRDELQGIWVNEEDAPVGTIEGGLLLWEPSERSRAAATLRPIPVLPNCMVSLSCPGEHQRQATFHPGPPAQLVWEDGPTWTRISLEAIGACSL